MRSGNGAQRASRRHQFDAARALGPRFARLLIAALVIAGFGGIVHAALRPSPVLAGSRAVGLKAVIIVGPASSSTDEYIQQADILANQAQEQGMVVTKIYTPNAYWSTVKAAAQGANLLVYFGHGNGFPNGVRDSIYEKTEDGLGLNPEDSEHAASSPTEYHGAKDLRANIQLAPNAVVLLYRLCFASGNSSTDGRDMDPADPNDRETVYQRVDNFASGFLAIGAGAVFAWGWPQNINLPKQLARTENTMQQIFQDPAKGTGYPNAYMGTMDYTVASTRTAGATVYLDPHPTYGYLRALTGNLEMTAGTWGGENAPPDTSAPTMSSVTATSDDTADDGSGDAIFSPDGDGYDDTVSVDRTLSESATLDVTVTGPPTKDPGTDPTDPGDPGDPGDTGPADEAGTPVLSFSEQAYAGPGVTTWNGQDANGARVPDGTYTIGLTPRDKAGNVGATEQVTVRVITALGRMHTSAAAIEVADGDQLASSVRFNAKLSQSATVSWSVANAAGAVIRQGPQDQLNDPTQLLWNWDGTDDAGAVVPDGTYTGTVAVTTPNGTVRSSHNVFVGAFRYVFSKPVLIRNQRVKLIVTTTEPLSGPLQLTIKPLKQKGQTPLKLTLTQLTPTKQSVAITWPATWAAGTTRFVLTGTDANGGAERTVFIVNVL